ncbi:hypothetical protein C6Y53_10925 [Pukyongiella litopenaei]|uniref:Uncharacterized protein n=1 Tax=Pukyongiella litopenaei TaxID=2605946 RepID=A0A2S0MQL6_9RHOB|nr:hypothetical protein C6Y53_10925 [Pukyongiella litopenaei]
MTIAARAIADRKTIGRLLYGFATHRKSFGLPNMISITARQCFARQCHERGGCAACRAGGASCVATGQRCTGADNRAVFPAARRAFCRRRTAPMRPRGAWVEPFRLCPSRPADPLPRQTAAPGRHRTR